METCREEFKQWWEELSKDTSPLWEALSQYNNRLLKELAYSAWAESRRTANNQTEEIKESVESLVNEILNYESDNFSSRANVVTRQEAELMAAQVIHNCFDKYDGYYMQDLLDNVRPDDEE